MFGNNFTRRIEVGKILVSVVKEEHSSSYLESPENRSTKRRLYNTFKFQLRKTSLLLLLSFHVGSLEDVLHHFITISEFLFMVVTAGVIATLFTIQPA